MSAQRFSIVDEGRHGAFANALPGLVMARTADPLIIAFVAALVAIALLGGLCYRLLLDRGRLLLRLEERGAGVARSRRQGQGLAAGAFLSDFALPRLPGPDDEAGDGALVTFSSLTGRPLLLGFLHVDCLYSRAFARELAATQLAADAPLPVSIVFGELGDTASLFSPVPGIVLLDPHAQVARLMRITATPSGYLVDAARRTVGPLLRGPESLLAVMRGAPVVETADPLALTPVPAHPPSRPAPPLAGEAAPDFTLPALAGGEWALGAQRGSAVLLLFSDPDCPPCQALLTRLGRLDQRGIAIVSRGDPAENRRLAERAGITAPVLLQRQREVARRYRTLETPAAFRISATGTIVAGPSVGEAAVLALLGDANSGKIRRNISDSLAS